MICFHFEKIELYNLYFIQIDQIKSNQIKLNMSPFNMESSDMVGKTLSGYEFNQIYKGVNMYKFFYRNLAHRDFIYTLGLNVDTEPFNPTGECLPGGLYFCQESDCYKYFTTYDQKVGIIEIPNDAQVYIEKNKFKADRLIIKNIIDFNDMSDEFWTKIIPKNGYALMYVKHQTPELCMMAINQDISVSRYVKYPYGELYKSTNI